MTGSKIVYVPNYLKGRIFYENCRCSHVLLDKMLADYKCFKPKLDNQQNLFIDDLYFLEINQKDLRENKSSNNENESLDKTMNAESFSIKNEAEQQSSHLKRKKSKDHNTFIADLHFVEINQKDLRENETSNIENMSLIKPMKAESFSMKNEAEQQFSHLKRKKSKNHMKNNGITYLDNPVAKEDILNNKGILLDIFYNEIKENQWKYLLMILASCLIVIFLSAGAFLTFKMCYSHHIRQKIFYKLMLSNEKNYKGGGGI